MKLAVIGVTGLVGREILKVLEEFNFKPEEFFPVASERSVGKTVSFFNTAYQVVSLEAALAQKPDIVIYSAGSGISLQTAKLFTEYGAYVIDNSSAWRMYPDVPLVVPEVNLHVVNRDTHLIANPNCSTIQLVVVLHQIHKIYRIKRLIVSTYQSVTGTGEKAVRQLFDEREGKQALKVYPHNIDLNCFPHGGAFLENGYTTEEMKLIQETHKILEDDTLEISPTVVRVPVVGGHSESVYIECAGEIDIQTIRKALAEAEGIVVQDDIANAEYPMPLTVQGKNETFVGRIRADLFSRNSLMMWIVADNLRKGAATNAVQIAEHLRSFVERV